MQRRHARLIAVVCMLCGCNAVTESTFEPEYVVESYLVASAPLPEILLSHSAPINVYQAFTDLGVSGAMMRLSLLTSAGTIEKSYPYTESRKARGVYLPLSTDLVLPTRTYLLEAYVPEGDIDIRARTSIPDTFSIRSYNKSEVLYQDREKVWLTMSRSRSDLPEPVYITSNMAIDNVVENLVPSQKSLYELSRGSIHLVSLRDVEGPLTLESRMEHSGDEQLKYEIHWENVNFYGRQVLTIMSLDRNLYDFIRTKKVQSGGSTLTPGEIPNVLDHIEGATGIFGSYAGARFRYNVVRP